MNYYLIFDIGGTSVKYAVSNRIGKFYEKGSIPAHQKNFSMFLEELGVLYEKMAERYPFRGIAVSSPGFVDSGAGITNGLSALPCIHHFPIAKELSARMGNLPVSMENDGNCGVLGEYWRGNGRGMQNVAMVVCGSGIGGGYVQRGKIHKTLHFSPSEFGFMPLVREKEKPLSWSAYSVVNTVKKYNKETGRSVNGKELFEMEEKDERAAEYVRRFYYYMAAGCLSIHFMLDPDAIIIGGAISERKDFLERLETMISFMKEGNQDLSCSREKLVISALKNDANLYGALYHFLHGGTCRLN